MAQRYLGTMIEGVTAVAESGASLLALNFSMSHNPLLAAAAHPLSVMAGKIRGSDPTPAPKTTEDVLDYGFEAARKAVPPLQRFLKSLGDGRSPNDGVFGMDWHALTGSDSRSITSFARVMVGIRDDPLLADSETKLSYKIRDIVHRVLSVSETFS